MNAVFGDALSELREMGWVFVAVFAVSWAFAALVFWISVTGTQRVQRRQARLLAQTSVFWSRWPGDRFWAAPYGELVAQAERYEQLIGILGQRKTLATPRFPSKQDRLFLDYLDGQLDDSRRHLAAVRSAMHHAIAQGRGPQQTPPFGGR